MTVNKERVELWVQALESGEYEQCKGILKNWTIHGDGGTAVSYCAEGVAIKVALMNDQALRDSWLSSWWISGPHATAAILDWYGFDATNPIKVDIDGVPEAVANINDAGYSFWDIAQALRATYLKDEG